MLDPRLARGPRAGYGIRAACRTRTLPLTPQISLFFRRLALPSVVGLEYGLGLPLDDWYSSPEDARQQTIPLHLNPLNWPAHQLLACDADDDDWFEGVERLASKLTSSGIPVTTAFESHDMGHCWDYFDTAASTVIDFVTDRLSQVHRTLHPG